MNLQQAKQVLEQSLRVTHPYLNNKPVEGAGVIHLLEMYGHYDNNYRWNEGWSIVPKEDNTVPTEDVKDYRLDDDYKSMNNDNMWK